MESDDKSEYSGLTVLVTGATGFIGSLLCTRLAGLGANICAVSRQRDITSEEPAIRWYRDNLAHDKAVKPLVASIKPDIVFHLASEVTGARELRVVMPTLDNNLLSTINLLVAAAESGCQRIVVAGSGEESRGNGAAAIPCSPYAAAKMAASGYARMFHALYETPVALARIFMVYGQGQRDLLKLVPYVTLSLLRGESPKLTSGQRLFDWIHVEDVVNGLLAMGTAPGIDGSTVDIGSGELVRTRQVVELLSDIVGAGVRLQFGTLPDRVMEQECIADVENTHRALGWRLNVPLRRGLEKTVDWYRRQLEQRTALSTAVFLSGLI